MQSMLAISIVVPVYNSEGCVFELTKQIAEALKDIPYEQIMVNDCSKDHSWQRICEVIEKGFPVVGINLRKNSGQDNALFAGLEQAQGKYVVIMDDDLQHSPSDIPRLYQEIQKGYDVVYADFTHKRQRFWKNLGSWFNGKIAELVIAKPKGLYLSPFKIIRHEVVTQIVSSATLYPYIDGLLFQVTRNIIQIPVNHHKREIGRSNYTLYKSIQVFAKLLFGFSVMPLRISSMLGGISACAGFLLAIYYVVEWILGRNKVEGWTTLVVLLLILGGLILLALGIIGEYVGRLYLTVNKNPRFTVAEIRHKGAR